MQLNFQGHKMQRMHRMHKMPRMHRITQQEREYRLTHSQDWRDGHTAQGNIEHWGQKQQMHKIVQSAQCKRVLTENVGKMLASGEIWQSDICGQG